MTHVPRPRGWRVVGWLLTPLVVWAASFLGGWLGAVLGGSLKGLVIGAVAGGVVGGAIWVLVGGARRSAPGPRKGEGEAPGAPQADDAGRGPSGT